MTVNHNGCIQKKILICERKLGQNKLELFQAINDPQVTISYVDNKM